jgi:hypothetical protein
MIVLSLLIAGIFVLLSLNKQFEKSGNANVLIIPDQQIMEINQESEVLKLSFIPYASAYNFAQTYNDCGPYNSAAVVRALTGENVSSAEFAKTITHRIKYKWTLPEGITEQLNQYGIKSDMPDFSEFSDYEKITYLREQLALQHPVVLLIKKDDFQHYITIFGFDRVKDEFYIYDSLMERLEGGITNDENGEMPGNKTITTKKLLEMWSGGGMLGKYKWLAIICEK